MTKSHTVQKTEGLEYYGGEEEEGEKRGGGVCFCAALCVGVQTGGSESCIFGIPTGQVAIGSASLGAGGWGGGTELT